MPFNNFQRKRSKDMKYLAVAIKDNYWVLLSKPTTKEQAEMFRGCEMIGETFDIKTETEVNNYKNVLK